MKPLRREAKGGLVALITFGLTWAITDLSVTYCLTHQTIYDFSMEPTIQPKDKILAELVYPPYDTINLGDVVLAYKPSGSGSVVKRVMGLPGMEVEYKGEPYTLKRGEFWLLGDNAAISIDSRSFKAATNLLAKVTHVNGEPIKTLSELFAIEER